MNRVHVHTSVPWHGNELATSDRWQYCLDDADVSEIDVALAGAQHLDPGDLSASTFPLPTVGELLQKIRAELANGTGVAKLIGQFDHRVERGEIQFLNNHAILHSRTAFTDDPGRGAQRRLLRIWLSTSGGESWGASQRGSSCLPLKSPA